jgi:hypothetical protein
VGRGLTREGENDDGTREETSCANTSNGAADDKGSGGGRNGGDEAANLEDEDGTEVGELDVEELVDSAVHGLQGGGGEKVGGAIPALGEVRSKNRKKKKRDCGGLTMSLTLLYSAVMAPRAGAMMVWSRATRKTAIQRETMMRTSLRPVG